MIRPLTRDTRIVLALLIAIGVAILGASTLCDFAIAHGASMNWRLAFRVMCHGIPSRCFELFGVPMPICARCSGIYAGFVVGALLFPLLPAMREKVMRIALYVAVVPMAVDGLTQAVKLRESVNGLRVATGLVAGIAFAVWALTAVQQVVAERQVTDFPMS